MQRRNFIKSLLSGSGTLLASRHGVLQFAYGQSSSSSSPGRQLFQFDFDWKFLPEDNNSAATPEFDDSSWQAVNLPHDWSIAGPFDQNMPAGPRGGFAPTGLGWYRKSFGIGPADQQRKVLIDFEGVYQNSLIWINGNFLGKQSYGYSGFQYDLTPFIRFGQTNLLAVRVDNSRTNSRWYTGSGIYRHVRLVIADKVRVAQWGTHVSTPFVSDSSARVRVVTSILNDNDADVNCRLQTEIWDAQANVVVTPLRSDAAVPTAGSTDFLQEFDIPGPKLWSPDTPLLYFVHSVVFSNDVAVDEYFTPFGIRDVQINKDSGLLLNGKWTKLKGVCVHHDLGSLGAAAFDRAIERRLEILKSIGCNAVRTSHNPPAPAFLDACDRMGFLVIDEAFDKWGLGVFPDVESPDFGDWWEKDLRAMLRRDRNHPSVVIWSVGNEAGIPGSDAHDGMLEQLVDVVHSSEPTRPVTCALVPMDGSLVDILDNLLKSGSHTDLLAINYQDAFYDFLRMRQPDITIVGTEAYPYFRNVSTPFTPDNVNPWYAAQESGFVLGQFVWSGFDYLGESLGWPSKGWSGGLIDTCGFLKSQALFFRSVWSAQPVVSIFVIDPMLKLDFVLPQWSSPSATLHWTFPDRIDEVFAVETPSNCETVELQVSGFSLGEQALSTCLNQTALWYVRYAPGTLLAIGRNAGQIVASYLIQSAGAPATIALRPDRTILKSDGQDLSHIEAAVTDINGVVVPAPDTSITFQVEGPARLIGVDNGDLRSGESYWGTSRTTRFGRCLAILQAGQQPGHVVITASATGLKPVSAGIDVGTLP
jgi:beta-galactosidase